MRKRELEALCVLGTASRVVHLCFPFLSAIRTTYLRKVKHVQSDSEESDSSALDMLSDTNRRGTVMSIQISHIE